MSFVTGLLLIDAPASALNNRGNNPNDRNENTVEVKLIRTRDGAIPYVSAQAFRYWLRSTLETRVPGWQRSPVFREDKIAYTDANPQRYWDDDLFGYMRAQGGSESAKHKREADTLRAEATEVKEAITRVSPFRVSTLVSVAPVLLTSDFGVMSRQEGAPVPHEHQFYHTTLRGLFSLDLRACGVFSYRKRTGFRNLDEIREQLAKDAGLEPNATEKTYRLPRSQRVERIKALFEGMALLEGGAKQALHYTDVAPSLVVLAVTKGGNHIFAHVVGADRNGQPTLRLEALQESLHVFADELLSNIYVGWVKGYLDEQRAAFERFAAEYNPTARRKIVVSHPREAFRSLVAAFDAPENAGWLA